MDAIAMAVFGGILSTGGKGNLQAEQFPRSLLYVSEAGFGQRNVHAQVILMILGILLIGAVALPNLIGKAKKAVQMKK